jgi:pilus assembly protein CpaB
MNMRRVVVLLLAAVAAGGVALLVRGMLGGGTPQANARMAPAPIAISEVLVASGNLQPGQPLSVGDVRWQRWPTSSVDGQFIVKASGLTAASVVNGTVVRAPIVAGEPITNAKIVKSNSTGFMAATLTPGMRAVSISVSVVSVAGGFILPNDRIDLILTVTGNEGAKRAVAHTVVSDVRVLAIDQQSDDKNKKAVADVKTVTLELTPAQAQDVARAQAQGTLSLALRALGDSDVADTQAGGSQQAKNQAASSQADSDSGTVSIIRYGISHTSSSDGGGN